MHMSSRRFLKKRYTFLYGDWAQASVTVKATNYTTAFNRACEALDRRYERRGAEPPVSWTLDLVAIVINDK